MNRANPSAPGFWPAPTKLGNLSAVEVESALASGPLDVVVALGALEQHGPHLPLATDQIIAEAVAEAVASSVGNCIVGPVLPVGSSSHHLSFAGTASLSDEVLARMQVEIVESLLSHGFKGIYLVTGHAGNSGAMFAATEALDERVVSFHDWPAQRTAIHEVAQTELGLHPDVVGTHAGHFETSIMLLLRPDLVRLDRAEPGFVGPAADASATLRSQGMAALSSNGVIGDPTGASAAAGELYLAALVGHVVDGIARYRTERAKVLQ